MRFIQFLFYYRFIFILDFISVYCDQNSVIIIAFIFKTGFCLPDLLFSIFPDLSGFFFRIHYSGFFRPGTTTFFAPVPPVVVPEKSPGSLLQRFPESHRV
jgi:hypothetical protein